VAQAQKIFDESFLSIRAKLLEVAAALDRLDRATAESASANLSAGDDAGGDVNDDPRRGRVDEAIALLLPGAIGPGERAAALQQLFSRRYEADWRERFKI
jgi:hypothetical protein